MRRLLGIGDGTWVMLVLLTTVLLQRVAVTQAMVPDEVVVEQGFDCADVTQIPQVECEALVTFYYATGGDDWWNNENWLVTSTPCEWYGITCDAGHVTELDGYDNGLIGSIPPELSDLIHLTFLALGGSGGLSGVIPPELGSLAQLETFTLYHNYEVSIPPELGSLSHLRELRITTDYGLAEPGDQSDLHARHGGAVIPPELGNLSALETLVISRSVGVQSRPNWAICQPSGARSERERPAYRQHST